MSECEHHYVMTEGIMVHDVVYCGIECQRCGARNFSHNARSGDIHPVAIDIFVDWMFGRIDDIRIDPETGEIVFSRLGFDREALHGIERGNLRLAAMNEPPRRRPAMLSIRERV